MKNGSPDTAAIITGKKRGGPRQLADYLMAKNENEYVHVRQIGCFVAKTVPDALAEMWAVADGCKAKDFLYHTSINPKPGVTLSQKQWKEAVDRLEKNLNLVGHQRVVVEHIKNGRTHYHVVWNRVSPQTGRVKKLSFDRRTLRATALELGTLFNLVPTFNKGQSFPRGDIERGKRTGIDPKIVKAEVTALWNKSKSGKGFAADLAKHGYILARGDKNQFVIIDRAGSIHGLTRRIHGATAKTVKRGMADVDPTTLPTIAEVRSRVKVRLSKAKSKQRRSAHPRGSFSTRKRGTSPIKAWRPYEFFLTSRHATKTTKPQRLIDTLHKNQPMIGTANPQITKSSAITERKSRGKAVLTKKNAKETSSGKISSASQYQGQPSQTDTGPKHHGLVSSTLNPSAPLPAVPPIGATRRVVKGETQKQQIFPFRPTSHGGMSQAQLADLKAAQEGKITWAEYFQKWGGGGLSL